MSLQKMVTLKRPEKNTIAMVSWKMKYIVLLIKNMTYHEKI